jgi:hypothetical protein
VGFDPLSFFLFRLYGQLRERVRGSSSREVNMTVAPGVQPVRNLILLRSI